MLTNLISHYWSSKIFEVNILIAANLLGALLLGSLIGYERSYNGRAAGVRTFGLVCMASCALTVFTGYSKFWFGNETGHLLLLSDPTRVIQGIVSGIGFLCAGVIMKREDDKGLNISGLSTAAYLWLSCAIGILIGVGFYGSAISLAVLSLLSLTVFNKIESYFPQKTNMTITLIADTSFSLKDLEFLLKPSSYNLNISSVSITSSRQSIQYNFMAQTKSKNTPEQSSMDELIHLFSENNLIHQYTLVPTRT